MQGFFDDQPHRKTQDPTEDTGKDDDQRCRRHCLFSAEAASQIKPNSKA